MTADKDTRVCATPEGSAAARIARLNDAFRRTCRGGTLVATAGVIGLGSGALPLIHAQMRKEATFTPANDPHGEHNFGTVAWLGAKIFWKIDYYDVDMQYGSPDPSDPAVTTRVMTIMLANEY